MARQGGGPTRRPESRSTGRPQQRHDEAGSLLIFAALFVRGAATDARHTALQTPIERHGNGLLAAMRWLAAEGIRTVSLSAKSSKDAVRFGTMHGRRAWSSRRSPSSN